ncbi:MAG: hypothetical protein LBH03_01480 [Holophagales bacterium]|jgi:hypothetical protein|nr:hypothetical protein [Holophagales bacterium]
MSNNSNQTNQTNKKTVAVLEITSRPDSFCRAGRRWTKTATQVPLSEFTKEQVKALKAESNLVVVEKDVELAELDGGE